MLVVRYIPGSYLGNGRYGKTSLDLQQARTFSTRGAATNAASSASFYMEANQNANGDFVEPPPYEIVEVYLVEGPLP